ncbi:MAG: Sulfite reductase [ferredoxin] [Alphaproteobacteria bacterium MarineAlpha9_Bin5]|nr:MAG: Sulfite reductase [ferredoxin] [Alphaproteobacteria bacterium MarineAlpha9_Bin6]PPR37833.1 MAG: Sulfite reductase [ferredoxin] [Alphaproteobacteria bacterium MarineAlpha9_Bin5]HHZ67912.1 nitrite/sulfite reductase [Alphaproteobacteria bacterium]HIO38041.1 nitrite/sulfite reductase [Rhodospirillales bacterium]HIB17785.1 nitrite/sulfite reductase [Alphaproteobacteria bacterium]
MYRYDEFDRALVLERVEQFRGQVARRLSGELEEEEFKALRLRNGLYLQLHAYMLRVAIPYGTLSSQQMRKLAHIARVYDRDYGHFTTRQNIQYNWPKLVDVPDILAELAEVEMHAIQTSGNCIRNVTADHFAGVAADEIEDPRVYAEIVRQWSTLHPEFSFLPRKFKIAVNGTAQDRAALRVHDIGLQIRRNSAGKIGFEVMVGGGQGRTPYIAPTIREFLPKQHLLSYLEAILRVYNQLGRRDNLYKARIKILVASTGVENFTKLVEEEWAEIKGGELTLPEDEHRRILDYFSPPQYQDSNGASKTFETHKTWNLDFSRWCKTNVVSHKRPGFSIITISLKPIGSAPGDASADQMDVIAGLAEKFSHDEIRVTHEQNLVLAHVCQSDIYEVWEALENAALSTPNIGLISDMITCPGLDYCNLANARSIPVAQNIAKKFEDLDRQHDIGELKIKISGCINACGHHHVGHIGILGVDKRGEEFYQITLGGSGAEDAALGDIVGRAFGYDEVTGAIETIVDTYVTERRNGERFLDTYRRVGLGPFKEALYGTA